MRYVVVALLLVAALSGVAVAQEAPGIDGATTTTFDVELQADGSAEWIVQTSIPVDSADEREAFRAYGERFVNGEATAGPGIEFFEHAASAASTEADRGMSIDRVGRNYSLDDGAGTLRLSFRWTNFLASDGTGYELADALVTADGTWLRSLGGGQELRLHTPPDYDIQRSSIEARQENESLVVVGPETYDPEEFSVVYQPEGSSGSPTPTDAGEEGIGPLVTGLIGLLVVVVGVLAVWRWRGGEPIEAVVEEPDEGGEHGAVASEPEETEPDGVDPELLSDEERVEALLERNGGRMRQAAIVEETDWSDAKVSQLLSRMVDEGKIEKLRLGRENVISFPDDEES